MCQVSQRKRRTEGWADRQTDGWIDKRYQAHYLPAARSIKIPSAMWDIGKLANLSPIHEMQSFDAVLLNVSH